MLYLYRVERGQVAFLQRYILGPLKLDKHEYILDVESSDF
jgi:hypothetical protein